MVTASTISNSQGDSAIKITPFYLVLAVSSLGLALLSFSPEFAIAGPPEPTDGSPPTGSLAYPIDPTADIPWPGEIGYSGVGDIEAAFNQARTHENSQLGISVPELGLPSQAEWDGKTDGEKALWLINREREDRGVQPLHGVEPNVTAVAQYYAEYLIAHDAFGHSADGRSPWERLEDNPAISTCHDFLSVAENLAVFWTSGTSIPLPVERAIYNWMYDDSGSGWGHRHAILWYPYNDNSGPSGKEGFLGIGRDSGPHQGWPYAEMIVMNIFDPCSTWNYSQATLGNLPDAVDFTYSIPEGRLWSDSQEVTPDNFSNSEVLAWEVTRMGAWFTVSPTLGSTPDSFWITPTGFDTGSERVYNGEVTVTVTNPGGVLGSPHQIEVTLAVVNTPFSYNYLPLVRNDQVPARIGAFYWNLNLKQSPSTARGM